MKIILAFSPANLIKNADTFLFTYGVSVFCTITVTTLNEIFFQDANLKNVWAPILITCIMILIYLGMIFIDLILGQRVAVKIRKEKFNPDRLIDTIAKVFATILISTVMMVLSILTEVIKFEKVEWISDSAWLISILAICVVWSLIIGYEYGSIGRHLESLTGSKPQIFNFFDSIFKTIQRQAIRKVEKSFNIKDDEKGDNINND